ncbi:hypothetical protein KI387_024787, partial [Taxus chinensis]
MTTSSKALCSHPSRKTRTGCKPTRKQPPVATTGKKMKKRENEYKEPTKRENYRESESTRERENYSEKERKKCVPVGFDCSLYTAVGDMNTSSNALRSRPSRETRTGCKRTHEPTPFATTEKNTRKRATG